MTTIQIIEKKYGGLQNLIDESADSRLNWNGIISKFNRPCGFILTTNFPLFALVTLSKRIISLSFKWSVKPKIPS